MPIYEYECGACGHKLDALQKMSEPALTDCPVCAKAALQKLISATSFQLKGTGWYVTDFRNKKQAESTKETTATVSSNATTEVAPSATSSETKSTDAVGT